MMEHPLVYEEWTSDHPAWSSLQCMIGGLDQASWARFTAEWHISSHFLVAHQHGVPIGFLRYVVQPIGMEADQDPVRLGDEILTEAKVIAFGVSPAFRRQGIGRRLQELLIERARSAGCYQVRSHSSASNIANHQLKLSLGFAIHPLDKTGDRDGAYFILPLRCQLDR